MSAACLLDQSLLLSAALTDEHLLYVCLFLRPPEDLPSFPYPVSSSFLLHKHCTQDQHPSVEQEGTSALLPEDWDLRAKGQRNDETTHVSRLSLYIWHRNRNPEETQTPGARDPSPAQPSGAPCSGQQGRSGHPASLLGGPGRRGNGGVQLSVTAHRAVSIPEAELVNNRRL